MQNDRGLKDFHLRCGIESSCRDRVERKIDRNVERESREKRKSMSELRHNFES